MKQHQQLLEKEINSAAKPNEDNPAINSAIKLIERSELVRSDRESQWEAIQELFEMGFEVSNPSGTKKLESQLLQQAVNKVVQKMKPLDVSLHSSQADMAKEKIVTDGVATVLSEGGLVSCLRDKSGAFQRLALFGDAFIRVGVDVDSKYPIKFQNASLMNIYIDPFATNFRSIAGENDVNELVAIYKYSWDEAVSIYPQLEKDGTSGVIPRQAVEELDYTQEQETKIEEREVEIAHYYNISAKRYVIFAGSALTVLDDVEGKDYPFMKDGDPYIPFLHFMCIPSSEGFYNYGIGHILYKLAIITRQLNNSALSYSMDNVDPLRIVNVPNGQVNKFFNKLQMATESKASGRKGFIINEYSPSDPIAGQNRVETLSSESLTTEWERLYSKLDQEVKRLGINLDDIDRGRNVTATQIISEEENASDFVKQILEYNATTFKFAWEIAIELIKRSIKKGNKTQINSTVNVKLEGQDVSIQGVTLGEISDELRKRDYFVKVNSRSGAIPSNIERQAKLSRAFSVLGPNDPVFNKVRQQFLSLNDIDANVEDLGGVAGPVEGQPVEEGAIAVEEGTGLDKILK